MKRFLLDTHVVIWWLASDQRLGTSARDAIEDGEAIVYISAVTAFEMSTKKRLGKLDVPDDLTEQMAANSILELPVTITHGLEAGGLPLHHKDPFDRLLVAQARCEDLTIVTSNKIIGSYDVLTLPAN